MNRHQFNRHLLASQCLPIQQLKVHSSTITQAKLQVEERVFEPKNVLVDTCCGFKASTASGARWICIVDRFGITVSDKAQRAVSQGCDGKSDVLFTVETRVRLSVGGDQHAAVRPSIFFPDNLSNTIYMLDQGRVLQFMIWLDIYLPGDVQVIQIHLDGANIEAVQVFTYQCDIDIAACVVGTFCP